MKLHRRSHEIHGFSRGREGEVAQRVLDGPAKTSAHFLRGDAPWPQKLKVLTEEPWGKLGGQKQT
jgi:galactose mutarotase-like enzyme